jgi:PAS domain S-box-containing protein
LFDCLPSAYLCLSAEGVILEVNCRWQEMLGYSSEEVLGQTLSGFLVSPSATHFPQLLQSWLETETQHSSELLLRHRNSDPIPVIFSTRATHTTHDAPAAAGQTSRSGMRLHCTLSPHPPSGASPQEPHPSLDFNQSLFDTANVIIVILNKDGIIRTINPFAEKLTGYSQTELTGKNWFEVLVPRDRFPHVWAEFERLLANGLPDQFENPLVTKSGEERIVAWKNTPLLEHRNVTGTLSFGIDVTESRALAGELRNRAELFSDIISRQPAGLYRIRVKGQEALTSERFQFVYDFVSDQYCELTGVTREELMKNPLISISQIHPEDFEHFVEQNEKTRVNVSPFSWEGRMIVKGRERWMRYESYPRVMENGDITGTGFLLDISERHRMENALRQSETRLKQSQRVALLGHYTLDIPSSKWTCSEMLDQIFGISPEDSKDLQTWESLLHPAHRQEMMTYFREEVVAQGHPFDREYRIINRQNKRTLWVHGLGQLHFGPDGKPKTMFGTIQDITQRKTAEEEMAAEKERLRVTLCSIGDGVITTDVMGRVVLMNRIAEQLTGWSTSEATGRKLTEVLHLMDEQTRKVRDNPVSQVLQTGKVIEGANHTLLIARDGRELVISDSGAPILSAEGHVLGVVLVFRDMTEKHKLAESLQKAQKLESLGILAGGIAHDFNNLLGGIFGYMELARRHCQDAKTLADIDGAWGALHRAKDLTYRLLTFAKGGVPMRRTSSLGNLVRECGRFALSGSRHICEFDLPDDLWAADFDEHQIGLVFDNILINAQQAMPSGGTISISGRNLDLSSSPAPSLPPGKYVKISFQDHGDGIPREILPRIFDPYFTTKPTGSGLGLATSYSIAGRHGGTIEVQSEPDEGSVFHLLLPASQRVPLPPTPPTPIEHKGQGLIFFMDDETPLRRIARTMLKEMGYETTEAVDGRELLAEVDHCRQCGIKITAILLDLTIPGGQGGAEIITELRRHSPDLPIFATSGYSDNPIMADPEQFGFTDVLPKPFTMAQLSQILQRHIRQ